MTMMPHKRRLVVLVGALSLVLGSIGSTSAYNVDLHEELSLEAFARARMGERIASYGLSPTQRVRGRIPSLAVGARSAEEWVGRGSRDEDSPWDRVRNHFFDPHHDRALTLRGVSLGARAPDWALEDGGEFQLQNHSYRDARQAFHGGLSLADPVGRERELGHTFYALGHVIHLIQDVSSPEHTRNDDHFSIGPTKSLLENYLEDNRLKFTPTSARLGQATMPTVAQARDLWVNPAGTGIAQFANAHFVSPDTNFTELRTGATAAEYPSPVLDLALVDDGPTGACRDGAQPPSSLNPLIFYGNAMPDPVSPALLINPRMTTHSIFDQHLQARGRRPVFAINCFTIDAAAAILLPRAVSYSAELLDYFFRGRPTGFFGEGHFRIVNRTSSARRAEPMDGRFDLYYDTAADTRQLLATWTLTLEADQMSAPLAVPLLADGQAARCVIVFRGRIGLELDGVAGQQLDRCPTATTVAGPLVEVGLPTDGGGAGWGSSGCPDGTWRYLIQICCFPGSPPHYASYCAPNPQAALTACFSTTAWFLNCRFP